jgi:hypothetical protein
MPLDLFCHIDRVTYHTRHSDKVAPLPVAVVVASQGIKHRYKFQLGFTRDVLPPGFCSDGHLFLRPGGSLSKG